MQSRRQNPVKSNDIPRRNRALSTACAGPIYAVEGLEDRTLFGTYAYVSFFAPGSTAPTGDGALTLVGNTPATIRAYVYGVNQDSSMPNPTPTGDIGLYWYTPRGRSFGFTAGGATLTPLSQGLAYADISVSSDSLIGSVPVDDAGDYQLIGYYAGDDNFLQEQSYPVGPVIDFGIVPPVPDQQAFIGVTLAAGTNSLAVTKQPTNTAEGAAIDPVKVSVLDASGSVDTTASGTVSARLSPGITGTGTLGGTTSASIVGGVATFSNLSISAAGQYGLTFTDSSGNTTASGLFKITGGTLVFVKPIKDGSAGSPLNPSVIVQLQDSHKHIITTDSSSIVTLSPIAVTTTSPQITGNVVQLVNGVATFSNLILKTPDLYKLQADDGGDTEATSARFKITGNHLVFKVSPRDTGANSPISYSIALENAKNQIVNDSTRGVGVTVNTIAGGAGAKIVGPTELLFDNGLATFTGPDARFIDTLGTYSFTADGIDSAGAIDPAISSVTSKSFKITGYHLAFARLASTADVNVPIPMTVSLLDTHNHVVTDNSVDEVDLSITNLIAGQNGSVGGTTQLLFTAGIAEFGTEENVRINRPGSYTFTATVVDINGAAVPAVASATSRTLRVTGYHLLFNRQPTNTDVYAPILTTITLKNARNQTVTQDSTDGVALTLNNAVAGQTGVLKGETSLLFENGVATYIESDDLTINRAGTYTLTATPIDPNGAEILAATGATSHTFKITGFHLVFATQPINTDVNAPLLPTISLKDAQNRIATVDAGYGIDLTLSTLTGGTNATLNGATSLTLENGVDAYTPDDKLNVDVVGKYTLTARLVDPTGVAEPSVDPVVSRPFDITGYHLVIKTQPASGPLNSPITLSVELRDARNKLFDTDNSDAVDLILTAVPSGTASPLIGTTAIRFQNGVATYTAADGIAATAPGKYVLTVFAINAQGVTLTAVEDAISRTFVIG